MFFPESIDLSESEKYILAIRLQAGSFSFAIHLPGKNDAYVYRETSFKTDIPYLQQIQRTIFDLNFLTQSFHSTYVQVVSPHYTVVPTELFDSKNKNLYLEKVSSSETRHVLAENMGTSSKQLVFDMDTDLFEFLSRNLFTPIFTHHTTSLQLLYNANSGKTELFSRMHLYFSGQQADVLVIRNGEMQFMQSFSGESDVNLFYFVMNIWEAFELNQLTDRLFISGDTKVYGKLSPLFNKYIQYVEERGAPSETFLLGEDASKTPIDLLALLL